MPDTLHLLTESLAGLDRGTWRNQLAQTAELHGHFQSLGRDHFAALIEASATLFVTFETVQAIRALNDQAEPIGWPFVREMGWSHLALVSDRDTWFRAPDVYDYFDRLTDSGFFDRFDRVLFYGAGPCGYAAAAFSVAAPGARVVAIQPQATLDPTRAGWDDRFTEERRRDFTSRYGYAPDMLEAANRAFILFDPTVTLDAMHATLFAAPHVRLVPLRHMGATIQPHLMFMGILHRLLTMAAIDRLDDLSMAAMMRRRRDYLPYLRNLLTCLERAGREDLVVRLCRHVTSRMPAPKFARRLQELDKTR